MMERDQAMKLFEEHKDLAGPYAAHFWPMVAGLPGITQEDMDQEALLAIWKAAIKYDPARGVKFSTYAWTYVLDAFAKTKTYCMRQSRQSDRQCGSLDALLPHTDNLTLRDLLPAQDDVEAECCRRLQIEADIKTLSEQQLKVLAYLIHGYSHYEIARAMGCSRQRISQHFMAVSRKIASF